ncbi:MAG TPA: 50S ribosomal protein L32 [Chloroflexi bacterium]|nr:50S ribosomal protein L32 [Chloroflexota bacterium]
MPPLPKRRVSSARRDKRRSHHALKALHLVACPNCGEKHLPHTVCPHCGYYNGREVIEVEK